MTSSRAFEVFHDRVDVTGLRAAGEEKVRWRGSNREEKVNRRRGLPKKRTRQKLNPWLEKWPKKWF